MKKWARRMSKLFFVSLLVLCMMMVNIASVYADSNGGDDFDYYLYKADMFADGETISGINVDRLVEAKHPSQILIDDLNKDSNSFEKKVNAWKALHFVTDPGKIAEGAIDEKGYYTAIILSAFKAESTSIKFVDKSIQEGWAETNNLISQIKKVVESADNIDNGYFQKSTKLSSMTSSEKALLEKEMKDYFAKNHPLITDSATVFGLVKDTIKTANTVGDAVSLLVSYVQAAEMGSNMKAVLIDLRDRCPDNNKPLKMALDECALASEDFESAVLAMNCNVVLGLSTDVLSTMITEGWKALLSSCVYSKAFLVGAEAGTIIGDSIANTMFSTDETVEQYEKMKCITEFIHLLRASVYGMEFNYTQNRTDENALNYFASVDVMKQSLTLSCDIAKKFGDIQYNNTAFGKWTIGEGNYNEFVRLITSIQGSYEEKYKDMHEAVDNELAEDYPDLFDEIVNRVDNEVTVKSISGKCGDDVVWRLYETGELVISGNGQMYDYTFDNKAPWADGNITKIRILSGVTSIGNSAFANCQSAESVTIAASVNHIGSKAFYSCKALTSVDVPSGVSRIEERTFELCDGLTSVNLKNGIRYIGESAFEGCTKITGINLPDNITDIDKGAFRKCISLTSVVIPSGMKSISEVTFSGCSSLTSVNIRSNITEIEACAFASCTGLKSIDLPDSVTSIGQSAFAGCSSLTHVGLPSGLKKIESNTFLACKSMTGIDIPDGLESIDGMAFGDCTGLKTISLANNIGNIGSFAFSGCSSLSKVTVKGSVTNRKVAGSIGGWAFNKCDNLTKVEIPENVTVIDSYAFSGLTSIASVNITSGVTTIGSGAFSGCTGLLKVTIPSGVVSIGEGAFSKCSSLTEITFPSTVNSIGSGAFTDCTKLVDVNLPAGEMEIGDGAFTGCKAIEELTIPEGITRIGTRAFEGCTGLVDVYISSFKSDWGSYIFDGCSNLQNVEFRDGASGVPDYAFKECAKLKSVDASRSALSSIGRFAFDSCSSLTDFVSSDSLTEIGDFAFASCKKLTGFEFPDSMQKIDTSAFLGCTGMTYISIPSAVTYIEENAFYGCTGIKKVDIAVLKADWGQGIFTGCKGLTEIVLGNDVTGLPIDTFSSCENVISIKAKNSSLTEIYENDFKLMKLLQTVELPDTLKTIDKSAFSGCSKISSIEIPASVVNIGGGAFLGCTGLKTVKLDNCDMTWDGWTFSGCTDLQTIEFGNSVKAIPRYMFNDCEKLDNVILPDSVTEIGEYAFRGCTSLMKVQFPSELKKIGDFAFSGCPGMEALAIPDGVTEVGSHAFDGWTNMTSVVIPGSISNVTLSFEKCDNLKKIEFKYGVKSVNSPYLGDGMEYAVIPESVTYISTSCFNHNVILCCDENSYAHKFAVENKYPYKLTGSDVIHRPTDPDPDTTEEPGTTEEPDSTEDTEDTETTKDTETTETTETPEIIDITKADTSISGVLNKEYTGNKIIQTGIKVVVGGRQLEFDKDYKLTYKNNTEVGKAAVIVTGCGSYTGSVTRYFNIRIIKNHIYTVGSMRYQVTKTIDEGVGAVTLRGGVAGSSAALTALCVTDYISISGDKYEVTVIGTDAFKNYKNLKNVSIGANVKVIGKNAFYGCSNLKILSFRTDKLIASIVGENAFKGLDSQILIKASVKKMQQYKDILTQRGMTAQMAANMYASDVQGTLSSVTNGVYTIKASTNSSYVMDVYGSGVDNGTNIALYKSTGANNQKFKITKVKSYWYKIEAECGKVLDVKGANKNKGANIQLWDYNGSDSQLFCFYKTSGNTYFIQNRLGCVIDISGGKALNAKNIHTWTYGGGGSQKWSLTSTKFNKVTVTKLSYGLYKNSSARITCGFDGYNRKSGKHEGIDIHYKIGAPVYALTDGVVVRVSYGSCGTDGLSTIAIYNKATNKTVVYLHSAPSSSLKAGQTVVRGQRIGVESWRGISSSSEAHTHVEVRNGRTGYAAKSLNDFKLDNQNPTSFWKGQGYTIN